MNLILMIVSMVSMSSAAQWEKLVDQVTQARSEIEVLSKQTDGLVRKEQADMDLWSQKKTEFETQLVREKLREKQINEKLKRLEARIKIDPKADPQGKKKLLEWLSQYATTMASTIPFHMEKRMAQVDDLKARVQSGHEAHEYILADFWSFLESEMKLSQTNDYRIVDVAIHGETKKCEVARLGLQALFVVTPNGKVLRAVNNGQKWDWQDIEDVESKTSVLTLVKNLKSKNSSGYYLLPLNKAKMGASL